ncbi:MAG: hypothetical protein MJZ07_07255 [Bacteroidales bacterium]|nr:hypothetical protein [Bacteroidales bacterium]
MKTKLIKTMILALGCVVSGISCKKQPEPIVVPDPVITLDTSEGNYGYEAGSDFVSFSIENPIEGVEAEVKSTVPWVKITETRKSAFRFSYDENENLSERTGTLILNYEKAEEKVFIVHQAAAPEPDPEPEPVPDPIILLSQDTFNIGADAGQYSFNISIENPVQGENVQLTNDSESWLTITASSNAGVNFSVSENFDRQRVGKIGVTYGNATPCTVTVTQDFKVRKPVIVVSRANVSADCRYQEITLSCNIENSVRNVYPDCQRGDCEWARWIGSSSWESKSEMTYRLEANNSGAERSFTHIWKYEGAEDVPVTVTQSPLGEVGFSIGSDVVILNKAGSQLILPYTIANPPDEFSYLMFSKGCTWLAVGHNESGRYIFMRAEENETGAVREYDLQITIGFMGGLEAVKHITVKQSCKSMAISISPSSAQKDYKAGEFSINVNLEDSSVSGEPDFSTSASWVVMSRYTSSSLTMSYSRNDSRDDRTAEITITYPNHESASFTLTQKGNPDFPVNVVDLGLPDGLLWAASNIGASSSSDAGNYYAWGETSTKSSYTWSNYLWGSENALTKYTGDSYRLDASDDVAAKTLGSAWRMPSSFDWIDLEDYCRFSEATVNGVQGLKITSRKNGKSIFIPYAGYMDNNTKKNANNGSTYLWCRDRPYNGSASASNDKSGWSFTGQGATSMSRYLGMPVRAVFDPSKL